VNDPLGATPSLTQWTLNTTAYSIPPDAKQKDTPTRIDTGDTRLLNAMVVGDQLWTTHTSACNWTEEKATRTCARWYQVNVSTPKITQQGTFGAVGKYYFYPAIFANSLQNAMLVFSSSSPKEYLSTRYTGRASSDTKNSLEASQLLQAGNSKYVQIDSLGQNRWGAYAAVRLDPADNCFWMHDTYVSTADTWTTRVGKSCFP
jgi:hypothetical protein